MVSVNVSVQLGKYVAQFIYKNVAGWFLIYIRTHKQYESENSDNVKQIQIYTLLWGHTILDNHAMSFHTGAALKSYITQEEHHWAK